MLGRCSASPSVSRPQDTGSRRIEDLVAWLKALSLTFTAIEATGGFETVVAAGLASAGFPVVIVNPAQVRAFAMALGKRASAIAHPYDNSPRDTSRGGALTQRAALFLRNSGLAQASEEGGFE